MSTELQLRSENDIPVVISRIDTMLAEAKTIPELNKLEALTAVMKELGKKADISLHAKNTLTGRYIDIRARRGEMLKRLAEEGKLEKNSNLKHGSNSQPASSEKVTVKDLGLTWSDSSRDQMLAELPKERREALSEQADEMSKEFAMSMCLAEVARNKKAEQVEELRRRETESPTGEYDVIVVDPPWDMQRIEREVRPNQAGFDYPVETEEQLSNREMPAAKNCHLWLWTTHKHLPSAMRILDAWGFKYVCTFVWHKPGGFQPVGLPQYNCEFALYARRGAPVFASTKDFFVCFNAPRGKHSEKPDFFFDMIKRVTAGHRLSMFERKPRDGFEIWGNEV